MFIFNFKMKDNGMKKLFDFSHGTTTLGFKF